MKAVPRVPSLPATSFLSWVVDALLIFLIAAGLVWPLLTSTTYLDHWESIAGAFIGDAHYLAENWPHTQWYPLWYGGTRFDYVYPPALRYGTAGLSLLLDASTARTYHLYTAFFYCFGIAGVYVFVRIVSGSRSMAWFAALATVLLSPAYLFLDYIQAYADGYFRAPQRLIALLRWGEGPHTSALALVMPALAASYRALTRKSLPAVGLAAVLAALVVSNNFYGGVSLTILFAILVWTIWITHRDHGVWARAAAIGALGYSLTAFWLVPSYLRITRANLSIVDADSQPLHLLAALALAAAFGVASHRWASRRPEACYGVFVCGALLAFGGIVLGEHWFGLKILGSPGRLVPEFDLALILCGLLLASWVWSRLEPWFGEGLLPRRIALLITIGLGLGASYHYVSHAWRIYPETADHRQRIEYRISEWVNKYLPGERTYVDGSTRFWFNTWHDLPYLTGSAHQGMLNQAVLRVQWQVRLDADAETSIRWLESFGVDAIIIHEERSQDAYDDYDYPRKFAGLLPVLYDNGEGDVIYRVPRRYPGLARVVERAAIAQLKPMQGGGDIENLSAYARAVEQGPDSAAAFAWRGSDRMHVSAEVEPEEMLLLQISYDPAWSARIGDRELETRKDVFGQMLVDVPPGRHEIDFVFELPLENLMGRILAGLGGLVVVSLLGAGFLSSRADQTAG